MSIDFPDTPTIGQIYPQPAVAGVGQWQWNGTAWVSIGIVSGTAVLAGYIYGLTLSTSGASATFTVATGEAADSTNAVLMVLGSVLNKTTSAFVAGNNNGGLDTGSIAASTWYHVHLIANASATTVDVLVSLSPTAPTMPSGFTLFRRIGSMKTNASSQWTGFVQSGNDFLWTVQTLDYNANPGTTPTLATLNLPTGVTVKCNVNSAFSNSGSAGAAAYLWSPLSSTVAPSASGAYSLINQVSAQYASGQFAILTDTSGRIYVSCSAAANNVFYVVTFGWTDFRGAAITIATNPITALAQGDVNRFRNGTMDIWQRGTSPAAGTLGTYAYTADGWMVYFAGANGTIARTANTRTGANSLYGMQITGATGNTDTDFKQRIESYMAAPLAGKTVTVQMQLYNNSGASYTPAMGAYYATAQDNFTSVTNFASVALQPCPNGVWTQIAYTFVVPASGSNGLELAFDIGPLNTTGKSWIIAELDVRATPGVATGLNYAPPVPEMRSFAYELQLCQRYFEYLNTVIFGGQGSASATMYAVWLFKAQKRASPTISATYTGTIQNTGIDKTDCYSATTYPQFAAGSTATAEL